MPPPAPFSIEIDDDEDVGRRFSGNGKIGLRKKKANYYNTDRGPNKTKHFIKAADVEK